MPDEITLFLQSDVFFIIGNLASIGGLILSIVSLILTVWVAFNVREIRRSYAFRARVPNLRTRLRQHAKQISQYMEELEDSRRQIRIVFGEAENTLNSLKGRVPKGMMPSVLRVLRKLKAVDAGKASKDEIFDVYAELAKIEDELKNVLADLESETDRKSTRL